MRNGNIFGGQFIFVMFDCSCANRLLGKPLPAPVGLEERTASVLCAFLYASVNFYNTIALIYTFDMINVQ